MTGLGGRHVAAALAGSLAIVLAFQAWQAPPGTRAAAAPAATPPPSGEPLDSTPGASPTSSSSSTPASPPPVATSHPTIVPASFGPEPSLPPGLEGLIPEDIFTRPPDPLTLEIKTEL